MGVVKHSRENMQKEKWDIYGKLGREERIGDGRERQAEREL